MNRRPKRDPLSLLLALKQKMAAHRPLPLATLPREELAAFQRLRDLIEPSKLLPYLDKKEAETGNERLVSIDERLLAQHYPGVDPLTGRLPGIDAFIYVYDGITGHERATSRTRGDLRQFLGEIGFRALLLELDRACKIHRFCGAHLSPDKFLVEPLTRKTAFEARKEAFAMHARAKEVFQQIAHKINDEMGATPGEPLQVYKEAFQFARDMRTALEPLALMARQVRGNVKVKVR